MLMKDGTVTPRPLSEALSEDMYALKVFMEMSETYQKLVVSQMKREEYGKTMRLRIEKTLEEIRKYGENNGIKK